MHYTLRVIYFLRDIALEAAFSTAARPSVEVVSEVFFEFLDEAAEVFKVAVDGRVP